jgi:hypothetical protein
MFEVHQNCFMTVSSSGTPTCTVKGADALVECPVYLLHIQRAVAIPQAFGFDSRINFRLIF